MPKPRLGQHFLADTHYLRPILEAAGLLPEDAVIEVGPGKGVLTRGLLEHAGWVLALELDERLANRLHERLGHRERLEIRQQDARRADWGALSSDLRGRGFAHVKLVANLPYYLATHMVAHALAVPHGIDRMVIMVQEEVARRMCALPGSKEYSSYSVLVQYYGEPRFVIRVPAKAFNPPPNVSSAVVAIERRLAPPVTVQDPDRFFFLVHSMFTHRRKTVRNCLMGLAGVPDLSRWEQALETAAIDPQRRPETLSMEELAHLFAAAERA